MPTPSLTTEQAEETAKIYIANGRDCSATAREMGLARSTVQNRLKRASELGLLGTDPVLPGFRIARVSTLKRSDGSLVHENIQQRPDHGGKFNLPDGHLVKGVSALVDSDGNVVQQWVKTRKDAATVEDIATAVREALSGFSAPPRELLPHTMEGDQSIANVFPIADAHMGLLAWGDETGSGSYDLKIAQETIGRDFARLAANTPPANTAVILGLGDNSHTDGYKNVTPQSGHSLDADGRYPRILRATIDMFMCAVESALPTHDNVIVRVLPGNHDPQTAIGVTIALAIAYANHPRVSVDEDPGVFWWWEWGKCLVGASHGDKAKMADMPMMMAARNPEAWGRTKFRHVFTGHIHHQTSIEVGGVIVESCRAVTAPDAYNAARFSNGRSLRSITFHKDYGEIGRQTVNLL